jgi:hypothetical protein
MLRPETQQDYRRRLTEVMGWIEANDPEQYDRCVIELNAEQANDPNLNYFGATHDFIYENLNFGVVMEFLSSKQSKAHIRKYHDALLFGCKQVGAALPRQYYLEMKSYLGAIQ